MGMEFDVIRIGDLVTPNEETFKFFEDNILTGSLMRLRSHIDKIFRINDINYYPASPKKGGVWWEDSSGLDLKVVEEDDTVTIIIDLGEFGLGWFRPVDRIS